MSINWQELLTTLGGGGLVLAAATWLTKTLITHGLTRDAEAFKVRIRADVDVEVERLKSSLQIVAYEHQVRFSNLHAKRAEVIAEIYAQMVDAEQRGKRFVYADAYEEESKRKEAYRETATRLLDFYFFLEKHKIYLPEHICSLMTSFVETVRKSVTGANMFAPMRPHYDPEFLEKQAKVVEQVSNAFEGSIPAARVALEEEFRQMLGVERSAIESQGPSITRTRIPSSSVP